MLPVLSFFHTLLQHIFPLQLIFILGSQLMQPLNIIHDLRFLSAHFADPFMLLLGFLLQP